MNRYVKSLLGVFGLADTDQAQADALPIKGKGTVTNAYAPVSPGGAVNVMTAAAALDVVSANAADAYPAGTGARVLRIEGYTEDSDGNIVRATEDVELNGTTTVSTTTEFIGLPNQATVISVGTGLVPAGNITISSGATTRMVVSAGDNNSRSAWRMVGTDEALVLTSACHHINATQSLDVEIHYYDLTLGIEYMPCEMQGDRTNGDVTHNFSAGVPFYGPCIVWPEFRAGTAGPHIGTAFMDAIRCKSSTK